MIPAAEADEPGLRRALAASIGMALVAVRIEPGPGGTFRLHLAARLVTGEAAREGAGASRPEAPAVPGGRSRSSIRHVLSAG
jgi:hypothetical protein